MRLTTIEREKWGKLKRRSRRFCFTANPWRGWIEEVESKPEGGGGIPVLGVQQLGLPGRVQLTRATQGRRGMQCSALTACVLAPGAAACGWHRAVAAWCAQGRRTWWRQVGQRRLAAQG